MTITQSNGLIVVSDTTITIEPLTIYTSRLISNHMYKLRINIESVQDLIEKVNKVSCLRDDIYIEFDRIHKSSLEDVGLIR